MVTSCGTHSLFYDSNFISRFLPSEFAQCFVRRKSVLNSRQTVPRRQFVPSRAILLLRHEKEFRNILTQWHLIVAKSEQFSNFCFLLRRIIPLYELQPLFPRPTSTFQLSPSSSTAFSLLAMTPNSMLSDSVLIGVGDSPHSLFPTLLYVDDWPLQPRCPPPSSFGACQLPVILSKKNILNSTSLTAYQ